MGTDVYCTELPVHIKGLILKNNEGSFEIIINSALDIEQQNEVYFYATLSIKNNKTEILFV